MVDIVDVFGILGLSTVVLSFQSTLVKINGIFKKHFEISFPTEKRDVESRESDMITLVKMIDAPAGCQVRRFRADGTVRNHVARWWGVWSSSSGDLWTGPCTSRQRQRPESMSQGFAGYIIPATTPGKMFL